MFLVSLCFCSFAKLESRFGYYEKVNSGVSATRKYGIDRANVKYVTIFDAR